MNKLLGPVDPNNPTRCQGNCSSTCGEIPLPPFDGPCFRPQAHAVLNHRVHAMVPFVVTPASYGRNEPRFDVWHQETVAYQAYQNIGFPYGPPVEAGRIKRTKLWANGVTEVIAQNFVDGTFTGLYVITSPYVLEYRNIERDRREVWARYTLGSPPYHEYQMGVERLEIRPEYVIYYEQQAYNFMRDLVLVPGRFHAYSAVDFIRPNTFIFGKVDDAPIGAGSRPWGINWCGEYNQPAGCLYDQGEGGEAAAGFARRLTITNDDMWIAKSWASLSLPYRLRRATRNDFVTLSTIPHRFRAAPTSTIVECTNHQPNCADGDTFLLGPDDTSDWASLTVDAGILCP